MLQGVIPAHMNCYRTSQCYRLWLCPILTATYVTRTVCSLTNETVVKVRSKPFSKCTCIVQEGNCDRESTILRIVKFMGIWCLNPLKTSGASDIGASMFGLEVSFGLGFE